MDNNPAQAHETNEQKKEKPGKKDIFLSVIISIALYVFTIGISYAIMTLVGFVLFFVKKVVRIPTPIELLETGRINLGIPKYTRENKPPKPLILILIVFIVPITLILLAALLMNYMIYLIVYPMLYGAFVGGFYLPGKFILKKIKKSK